MANKIAIVRVRGGIRVDKKVNDTLDMLKLFDKNYCAVIEATPQNLGMIKKVKDFVTYGDIQEDVYKELFEKRGELYENREQDSKGKISYKRRYVEIDGKKYKKYFRLSPPKKGYGRKGIKKPFSRGGALGNRKDMINDLIRRMI